MATPAADQSSDAIKLCMKTSAAENVACTISSCLHALATQMCDLNSHLPCIGLRQCQQTGIVTDAATNEYALGVRTHT